jgi:DNA-binding LytR/AlgR family response regulator
MPGLTVRSRATDHRGQPADQLVFVTAFDQCAVDAFSVNAVDYLLKPVDLGRLPQTLDRARRRLASEQATRLPLAKRSERVIGIQARQAAGPIGHCVGERFVLVQAEGVACVPGGRRHRRRNKRRVWDV